MRAARLLSFLAVCAVLLAGCGKAGPAPAAVPTPEPDPAQTGA